MRKLLVLLFFFCPFIYSYGHLPKKFIGNYIGEKMWNTQKMIPYSGSVSLAINDTIAIIKYSSTEKVDTFNYKDFNNTGYRYERCKHRFLREYIILSKDSSKLQIGEPGEINYFYRKSSN